MALADVLIFLNGELAHHGSDILTVTDLSALAAVERRIDGFGLPDADTARAVAWTACLTPAADRGRFEATFGPLASALLDTLVPAGSLESVQSTHLRGLQRDNLRIAWVRATASADAQVRGIATALLASETEKTSNAADRDRFCGMLDVAVRNAPDDAVRAALTEIRDGLAPTAVDQAEPGGPTGPVRLISMSIDVVGSTRAKRRLLDLSADEARRNQLYEGFYASFLDEEDRFYADLFAPGIWNNGPPLDWRRLFVVKGIGDELWLTYDASPPEGVDPDTALRQATVRLISAALSLAGRTVSCGGTAEDLGPHFDHTTEERQVSDWMELPFKVTIDLVQDAIEISGLRLEHFAGRVGSYLFPLRPDTGPGQSAPFGAAHAEILRRLNAGHFELAGGHRVRQAFRTDFIGPDIDRFFRITKFALPGLVMVGDDLMRALSFKVTERYEDPGDPVQDGTQDCGIDTPRPEFERIELSFPCDLHRPDSDVAFREPLIRRLRPIGRDEMKGVDATYAVHHLVSIPSFRDLVHEATRNPFLKEIRAAYPESLRTLIAPGAAGEPPDDNQAEQGQ